jgi:uncharacterized protein YggT (Ycf19 family)
MTTFHSLNCLFYTHDRAFKDKLGGYGNVVVLFQNWDPNCSLPVVAILLALCYPVLDIIRCHGLSGCPKFGHLSLSLSLSLLSAAFTVQARLAE